MPSRPNTRLKLAARRRLRNESFFSAPQLKRGPLGSTTMISPGSIDDVVLKRFEAPDEVREFTRGRFELVTIGGMTIGRATYQPGWKWSVDVGPTVGETWCRVQHLGLVLQGKAVAAFDDGRIWELAPGSLFHIPADPHDSWVVGDEPYVSLHFLGASHYAK